MRQHKVNNKKLRKRMIKKRGRLSERGRRVPKVIRKEAALGGIDRFELKVILLGIVHLGMGQRKRANLLLTPKFYSN